MKKVAKFKFSGESRRVSLFSYQFRDSFRILSWILPNNHELLSNVTHLALRIVLLADSKLWKINRLAGFYFTNDHGLVLVSTSAWLLTFQKSTTQKCQFSQSCRKYQFFF